MDKIFPHHIYKFKVSNYENLNKKLISEIYDLREDNKLGIKRSNKGGWHSKSYFIHQDCNVPTELLNMSKIIYNFYSENVLKNKKYIEVFTMLWVNINNKEDYNILHTHPHSHYSGVYYVRAPKNSGNLYFDDSYEIIPEEGMLYMWESHLEHGVNKNKTNKDRVSISFNFNFDGLKNN